MKHASPRWIDRCAVYTPDDLAHAIVKATIPSSSALRCLEPSFGEGAFLRALESVAASGAHITGVEYDRKAKKDPSADEHHIGCDFLNWSQKVTGLREFDVIVGNPPFAENRTLPQKLRYEISRTTAPAGKTLSGRCNLWAAFLARALKILAPNGSIGFVLPAAWQYATYAAPIREYCKTQFMYYAEYRSSVPLFQGIKDGVVVVVAKGFGKQNISAIYRECNGRTELVDALLSQTLTGEVGGTDQNVSDLCNWQSSNPTVGSLLDIRIGAVTGDARYFLINEYQRKDLGLPIGALTPILSRARHVAPGWVTRERWEELKKLGERVWLFKPSSKVIEHPCVRRYLKLKQTRGGCNRLAYKVRMREPWYDTSTPARVDGFVSGMSAAGPVLALNSMPNLTASNTLYVVRFKSVSCMSMRASVAAAFLSTVVQKQVEIIGRKYADGLMKLEPGELANVRLPIPLNLENALEIYSEAVRNWSNGECMRAQQLVDRELFGIVDNEPKWDQVATYPSIRNSWDQSNISAVGSVHSGTPETPGRGG